MKPLVTVVIPNYNYGRFLRDAVDSALGQTFSDLEVLVIDNGSTDDSLEVLKSFGPRIRWITQENRGQSGSRNRGIEESSGAFVAFLDADDVWLAPKLEKQMALFANRPEVGLVYSGHAVVDSSLKPKGAVVPHDRGDVLERFAVQAGAVVGGGESTAVIRKACFDRLGTFDPELSICAGWDMYRRIACCYDVDVVPEPLMLYRVHGSNATRGVDAYAHDVERRLRKMFSDPLAERIHRYRRMSYGKSYLAISGGYLHAGQIGKALAYAVRSIWVWPPSLAYIASMPARALRRRQEPGPVPAEDR